MTALTKTQVANLALRLIGTYRVQDVDADESPQALAVRDAWEHVLRRCLGTHLWQFAKKQRELARLPDTPAARYEYEYQLPGDFIRLGTVSAWETLEPPSLEFMILGNKLLSNDETVFIEYGAFTEAVSTFPPWFVEYLRTALAIDLAPGLKATSELPRLVDLEKLRLQEARSADSVQHPPKRPPVTGWIAAMQGGTTGMRR